MACMHRRERGASDPFGDDWLPGLRAGGVVFQVLPVFTEEQFVGEAALRRTLEIVALAREIAVVHRHDVAIAERSADIAPVIASGRIALLIAIEGAEPVGSSISMFETLHRLGVRMASLTWNRRTMLADGIAESGTGGRLSSLGVEAVAEMERLGMVVDISHLSAAGVDHLAEVATRPFVASHSSCRALCDHPRNLTDDQIRLVARSGGFVAVNAFGAFVSGAAPTIDRFVDHIEHAAAIAGEGRVAIGADFIEDLIRMVDPVLGRQLLVDPADLSFIDDLKAPSDYANLSGCLVERFGPARATRFASANMLDFFRANLPPATKP
ncbi:MAG: thermostable dipeptidase [Acidimicrobiaceae bacterium]|nr:thermostable dipeptidase [Acidimicrobiaceae bacterium]MXZ99301.1 thermostable dipeptidase [Acidimicrobiaceae bacterium]MYE56578.1 thermostable dipeptidase [Acidimicrobiaceae bacterium]MYE77244.1 thermostable dipeptidase [Acidimicrobiaceae bacterium]MYH43559.1 thermostable dipeptidase [Acidimicrobiaceae bacterium]